MVVTLLSTNPTRLLPWMQRAQMVAHPLRLHDAASIPPPVPDTPVLLDTTDLPPLLLCRVLCALAGEPRAPTLALVAPDDRTALYLLHRCPAVLLLCTARTAPPLLQSWLRLLNHRSVASTPSGPCLLDPALAQPALTLPAEPALFRLLPVLADAATWEEAARAVGYSVRHLHRATTSKRQRTSLRVILDLPEHQMSPYGFTQQVLAALADAPVAGEAERAVG
jgi:hypothetical protein